MYGRIAIVAAFIVGAADESSYSSMTIEDLLDANVLPAQTVAGFRNRYVVDNPSR